MKVEEVRCDRCGVLIRNPRYIIGRASVNICINVGLGFTASKEADLCPKCNDELHRFLFNYKKPTVDESQITEDAIAAEQQKPKEDN